MINLNPVAQAEEDFRNIIKVLPLGTEAKIKLLEDVSKIVDKTVRLEKFFIEPHPDCGADNPKGKVKLCKCACHNGHYRHYWDTKSPVMKAHEAKDGSFHIIERCKYCATTRLKVIKSSWVGEKHRLISLEYHIKGETRVLTKEEWLEKKPKEFDREFMAKKDL